MAEKTVTMERTLQKLLEEKKYTSVRDILVTMNAADVAYILDKTEPEETPLLFRLLPRDLAAASFAEMENDSRETLIRSFSDAELRSVMNEMFADDAADLVEDMPAGVVQRILAAADPEMRRDINTLLRYPEQSAGAMMTTEYVALRPDMTVGEAFERIRGSAVDKETIYTCYVTQEHRLLGIVSVKDLLLAKNDGVTVGSLMDTNVITVNTRTDQEQVAQMLSRYNFLALPVLDDDDRMVGIVTFDDAMDVMVEETTEDIEKMAGVTPMEKTYSHSDPWDLYKHRIPWLLLLMVSATFTGMIITGFESALAAQVALTAFIPMLMDTGGNSGSQASVSIIRAISLGELEFGDIAKVIWKEVRTAAMCGVTLACACFAKIMLVDRLLMGNTDVTVLVAAVVCVTLALTVVVAKLVGCTLPMLAKRVGFDPAVMASPLITTIVDALSLLVYFGIATALLF